MHRFLDRVSVAQNAVDLDAEIVPEKCEVLACWKARRKARRFRLFLEEAEHGPELLAFPARVHHHQTFDPG